jgi:fermentation-respiration switch protein FrsA (DUF1100 family)
MNRAIYLLVFLFALLSSCTLDSALLYNPDKVDEYYYKQNIFSVEVDGNTIYGVFIPAPANSPMSNITVIFFHGNSYSMNKFTDVASLFHDMGVNFVMFDYRGFGKSTGKPTEEGLYNDSEAIVKYVLSISNINTNNIFYVGHSLGSATSIETTLKIKPKGLILVAGFTSMDDMTDYYTTYSISGDWVLNGKYDNLSKIDRINVPVLLIHGNKDTTVPYWMSKTNYDKAKEPKKLVIVDGANHGNIFVYKTFYDEVKKFLTSYSN